MKLSTNQTVAVALAVPLLAAAGVGCGTTEPKISPPAHGTGTAPATTSPATPAPSPKQAQVGDKFTVEQNDGAKYDVTLLSVDQNAVPASEFDAAPAGSHLAAAQFRVTAITKVDENANNNATATGSNEQAYTTSIASVRTGTNFANGQVRLQPGGSLIGWVAFTLPDGVHVTKVQWTPQSGFAGSTAEWHVSGSATASPGPTAASPSPTGASPSPTAASPSPTAALPSPSTAAADTVRAYFEAITRRDFAAAWSLGGRNTTSSYNSFVSGFSTTVAVAVDILSVSGNTVTARVDSLETDGSTKSFQGTYTVSNGVITKFHVHQVS